MAVQSKKIPAPDRVVVRRALLSVSDKSGLVEFASRLADAGVELISTGGTAKTLGEAGLAVRDVSEITGFPEIMDGRVKTLHPAVHGALLGIRDDSEHASAMETHGIHPIDLLVVNLYPFEAVTRAGADYAEAVENIDIGGPAMIRAAAKNHAYVGVVTDIEDYDLVLEELAGNGGALTLAARKQLAARAFGRTAAYDSAISTWFGQALDLDAPRDLAVSGRHVETLRYGENPHQEAWLYATAEDRPGVVTAEQVQGKQLSWNNINDTDAAFELVSEFGKETAAVAIIKHANPCGVATGDNLLQAWERALACDPVSAFGGIVALNTELDADAARAISDIFTEVIIAPSVNEAALEILSAKKNLRLLTTGGLADRSQAGTVIRSVAGGLLVQSRDSGLVTEADLKFVTQRLPSKAEISDMLFAFTVAKHVKSNAIVYARDGATVGIGAGQMSRVDSARIAAQKARDAAAAAESDKPLTLGSVVASDAFFPFADGLLVAIEAGATAVIQPGGSMRDDEVIAAANEAGIAMAFTGMRHFRH